MKIYRYNKRPANQWASYQRAIVHILNGPRDYNEYCNHQAFYEPTNWYFGFTKDQLRFANLLVKENIVEVSTRRDMWLRGWANDSKLISFEVPDEHVLVLDDQVVFYAPSASVSLDIIK